MSVILGIDLGTSSVKAMLLDSVKGVISVESSPYEVSIPFEGYAAVSYTHLDVYKRQLQGSLYIVSRGRVFYLHDFSGGKGSTGGRTGTERLHCVCPAAVS